MNENVLLFKIQFRPKSTKIRVLKNGHFTKTVAALDIWVLQEKVSHESNTNKMYFKAQYVWNLASKRNIPN